MHEQEFSAAFEVFAFFRKQLFLKVFSDLLYRPSTVANNVEAINHNRGIREHRFCDRKIIAIHIHHKVLHLLSVWKFM